MCRYSAAAEAEVTISSLLTATPNFASLDATSSLDSVELLVTNYDQRVWEVFKGFLNVWISILAKSP